MTWEESTWEGCYDGNWKGIIVPDAYRHPAKFARGLIQRIYRHMLERGYVKPGMTIVDPFGGVALGAVDAMENGLRWVGVELEPHFHKLGNENLALWSKRWGLAGGTLLQGDSRRLCAVLTEAGACVSSPPFCDNGMGDHRFGGGLKDKSLVVKSLAGGGGLTDYGTSPGQLGQLPAGDVGAVLSSPPYVEGLGHGGNPTKGGGKDGDKVLDAMQNGYGDTPGQLGAMPAGDSILSSPPYEESRVSPDGNFASEKYPAGQPAREAGAGYGGLVSSPPYSQTQVSTEQGQNAGAKRAKQNGVWEKRDLKAGGKYETGYGESDGQLSRDGEETFWSAARLIVLQCAAILPVGAYAAWVTKDFVRDKQRVPFSDQWRQLCESAGFTTVEWIKASLVKETTHATLFDGNQTKRKERKSFFRRLAEKKGSPRIDHEDVLILRRTD